MQGIQAMQVAVTDWQTTSRFVVKSLKGIVDDVMQIVCACKIGSDGIIYGWDLHCVLESYL